MDIREFTKQYSQKSNLIGGLSYLGTFAVYFAALSIGTAFVSMPLIALPMVVILAFASVRLYVLQHDCGHYALFDRKKWNDVAGYILSVFSLTPYRVMQFNHNQHHAHLGNLEHRESTEIYTMTVQEWSVASLWTKIWYSIYRNPVIMLGLGGFYTYFIAYRWPRNTRKVGVAGVLTHNALLMGYIALLITLGGWPAIWVWGASAVLAGVIGVFLVYLQHNFEDTYWDRKPDLDFRKATLIGSSSLNLGWLWDLGTGNIAYHDLHHFNPSIPSYRLRRCQKELPEALKFHDEIRWPDAIRAFRLKLWDEDNERLVPFPAALRNSGYWVGSR